MPPKPPIDFDRIDDAVLALLFLGICDTDRLSGLARARTCFEEEALDRLFEKGLIDDPTDNTKSVWFTQEGLKRAEALFYALFAKAETSVPDA